MKTKSIFNFVFLVPFFLPLFFLFKYVFSGTGVIQSFDVAEFYWGFKNSLIQSVFSSLFSLLLGYFIFKGLVQLRPRVNSKIWTVVEFINILPSLLPGLFILLIGFMTFEPFPMGTAGIILLHTFSNAGLCGQFFLNRYDEKLISLDQVSQVLGLSEGVFFRKTFSLIKQDLVQMYLFLFILCFSSFAIPLVAGGGHGTTLEVLIYEKVRIENNLAMASLYSLIQFAILCLGIWIFLRPGKSEKRRNSRAVANSLFGSTFNLSIILVGYAYLIYQIGKVTADGWAQFLEVFPELSLPLLGAKSILYSIGVSLATYILLILSSLFIPNRLLAKTLYMIQLPSMNIFAIMILFLQIYWIKNVNILFVLIYSYISFVALFKMGWSERLINLELQNDLAEVLSMSLKRKFLFINWLQLNQFGFYLSFFAGAWVLGDFVLSKLIFSQDVTLAMLSQTLLSSYRIDLSFIIFLLIICVMFMLFILLKGLEYVVDYLLRKAVRLV